MCPHARKWDYTEALVFGYGDSFGVGGLPQDLAASERKKFLSDLSKTFS